MTVIARFVPLAEVARVLADCKPGWVVATALLSLVTRLASAMRTYSITSGMQLPLTRWAAVDALLAANFWSLVLPGVSAGSVATVHKYRTHGVPIAESVSALTASRATELAAFAALCLVALYTTALPVGKDATPSIPLAFLAIAVVALVVMHRHAAQVGEYLRRLSERRFSRLLGSVSKPFDAYSRITTPSLLRAIGAGMAQALLEAATIMAVARAVDVPIGLPVAMSIAGFTYLMSLVPVSIAGIGLRDAAVLAVTAPLGIAHEQAVAMSTLMLGAVIFNGLVGGLVQMLMLSVRAIQKPERSSAQSIS